MWRVVAIFALSLSGCVSNRSISQPMDFWEGLFIGYLITVLWLVFIYWLVSKSLPCLAPQSRSQYQSPGHGREANAGWHASTWRIVRAKQPLLEEPNSRRIIWTPGSRRLERDCPSVTGER